MTQTEVAKKLGTTQKVIWHRMKEAKYKCRSAKARNQTGDKNNNLTGMEAGYSAIHYRVYKARGKASKCDECGSKNNVEWVNINGKGTTGVACKNLKRKFILIEKEQKYCKIARNIIYGDLFCVDK